MMAQAIDTVDKEKYFDSQQYDETQSARIKTEISKQKFDKTISATIIDATQAEKGRYYVKDENLTQYWVYSNDTTYQEGDQIFITIPQSDYSKDKIIIGKKIQDQENDKKVNSNYISDFLNFTGNIIKNSNTYEVLSLNDTFDVYMLKKIKTYFNKFKIIYNNIINDSNINNFTAQQINDINQKESSLDQYSYTVGYYNILDIMNITIDMLINHANEIKESMKLMVGIELIAAQATYNLILNYIDQLNNLYDEFSQKTKIELDWNLALWLRDATVDWLYTSIDIDIKPLLMNLTNKDILQFKDAIGAVITIVLDDESTIDLKFPINEFLGRLYSTHLYGDNEQYYKQEIVFSLKDIELSKIISFNWHWIFNENTTGIINKETKKLSDILEIKTKNPVIKIGSNKSSFEGNDKIILYTLEKFKDNKFYNAQKRTVNGLSLSDAYLKSLEEGMDPTSIDIYTPQTKATFYISWLHYNEDIDQVEYFHELPDQDYKILWYTYQKNHLPMEDDKYSSMNWPRTSSNARTFVDGYLKLLLKMNNEFAKIPFTGITSFADKASFKAEINNIYENHFKNYFQVLLAQLNKHVQKHNPDKVYNNVLLDGDGNDNLGYIKNFQDEIDKEEDQRNFSKIIKDYYETAIGYFNDIEDSLELIIPLTMELGTIGAKAVILKCEEPLLSSIYTNTILLENGDTNGLSPEEYGNPLTLVPTDGTDGVYNLYNLSGSIRKLEDASQIRSLSIYHNGKPLDVSEVSDIRWFLPSEQTMIKPLSEILFDGNKINTLYCCIKDEDFISLGELEKNKSLKEYLGKNKKVMHNGVERTIDINKLYYKENEQYIPIEYIYVPNFFNKSTNTDQPDRKYLLDEYKTSDGTPMSIIAEPGSELKLGHTYRIQDYNSNNIFQNMFLYQIKEHLDRSYNDNYISVGVVLAKDNTYCQGGINLRFGNAGANGSPFNFYLSVENNKYPVLTLTDTDSNTAELTIKAHLENLETGENLIYSLEDSINWTINSSANEGGIEFVAINGGMDVEGEQIQVNEIKGKSMISLVQNKNCAYAASNLMMGNRTVLEAEVVCEGYHLNTYLPIALRTDDNYIYLNGTTDLYYDSASNLLFNEESFMPYELINENNICESDLKYYVNSSISWKPLFEWPEETNENTKVFRIDYTGTDDAGNKQNYFVNVENINQAMDILSETILTDDKELATDTEYIIAFLEDEDNKLLRGLCRLNAKVELNTKSSIINWFKEKINATLNSHGKLLEITAAQLTNFFNNIEPAFENFTIAYKNLSALESIGLYQDPEKIYAEIYSKDYNEIVEIIPDSDKSENTNPDNDESENTNLKYFVPWYVEIKNREFSGYNKRKIKMNYYLITRSNTNIDFEVLQKGLTNDQLSDLFKHKQIELQKTEDGVKKKTIFKLKQIDIFDEQHFQQGSTEAIQYIKNYNLTNFVVYSEKKFGATERYLLYNKTDDGKETFLPQPIKNTYWPKLAIADSDQYLKDGKLKLDSYYFVDSSNSDDYLNNNCINVVQNGVVIWSQPILQIRNLYPSAIVNNWNDKVNIDEDNGAIAAPMLIAGKKNTNNTFSGVILGTPQGDHDGSMNYTGIYGYGNGVQTYGFRSDGTAFIGTNGSAQIRFDGNESTISSGNFNINYINKTRSIEGTKIDLDDGTILSKFLTLEDNKITLGQPSLGQIIFDGSNNAGTITSYNYLISDKKRGLEINTKDGSITIASETGFRFKKDYIRYTPALARAALPISVSIYDKDNFVDLFCSNYIPDGDVSGPGDNNDISSTIKDHIWTYLDQCAKKIVKELYKEASLLKQPITSAEEWDLYTPQSYNDIFIQKCYRTYENYRNNFSDIEEYFNHKDYEGGTAPVKDYSLSDNIEKIKSLFSESVQTAIKNLYQQEDIEETEDQKYASCIYCLFYIMKIDSSPENFDIVEKDGKKVFAISVTSADARLLTKAMVFLDNQNMEYKTIYKTTISASGFNTTKEECIYEEHEKDSYSKVENDDEYDASEHYFILDGKNYTEVTLGAGGFQEGITYYTKDEDKVIERIQKKDSVVLLDLLSSPSTMDALYINSLLAINLENPTICGEDTPENLFGQFNGQLYFRLSNNVIPAPSASVSEGG